MAYIDIDIEEHLDEVSDEALRRELAGRPAKAGNLKKPRSADDPEPWAPIGLADDLRTAFYARNAARMEMLLGVLELHEAPVA